MQSIEKERMIPFEVSFREVAVKRKIEAQTKIPVLKLPLSNKSQTTPKFARVSESEVGEKREPSKSQMANASDF